LIIVYQRGSALAAATGGNPEIGKEAILKLMEAVIQIILLYVEMQYNLFLFFSRWRLLFRLPREKQRSLS
jgi:hypothetical protein